MTEGREIYTKRWVGTENAGLGTRGTRSNKSLSYAGLGTRGTRSNKSLSSVVKVIAGTRGTR